MPRRWEGSQPVREPTADCGAVFDDALRQLEAQQFILAATGPHEAHDLCAREFVEMYVACRAAPLPPEAQRLMPAQLLIQIEVRNGYRCG